MTPDERKLLEDFALFTADVIGLPRATAADTMRYLVERFERTRTVVGTSIGMADIPGQNRIKQDRIRKS